jgi:nicotinamide mononucleotide adenylyltransferase
MADYNLITTVILEIQYPNVQTSNNISIATIQNQILNNSTLATIISDIQPNIIQNQTVNNSSIASITSTLEASTIQNQTINNTNYTSVDPNPESNVGDYNWKYCFFTKNNEGIIVAGYVDNITVLEHVVATFN